jgi:hypothetical protein
LCVLCDAGDCTNTYANPNRDCDIYADTYGYGYSYGYADTYSYAYANTDANDTACSVAGNQRERHVQDGDDAELHAEGEHHVSRVRVH